MTDFVTSFTRLSSLFGRRAELHLTDDKGHTLVLRDALVLTDDGVVKVDVEHVVDALMRSASANKPCACQCCCKYPGRTP